MDTVIQHPPSHVRKQESDNEEQELFDQMSMSDDNPFENLELSSEVVPQHQEVQQEHEINQSAQQAVDFRQMMRQSKKEKNKEKKKNKLKAAKSKQVSKKQNINTNIVAEGNKKRQKKMVLNSDDELLQQQQQQQLPKQQAKQKQSKKKLHQKRKNSQQSDNQLSQQSDDSAQYSNSQQQNFSSHRSANNKQDEIEQHNNELNSPKKRLGRKSRMQRILQKQGFDLKQLGNQADPNYQLNESINQSDDSFSSTGGGKKNKRNNKKVKRQKKEKKQQLSNQQFLSKLKEIGCQDEVEENDEERYNYDSGIEELTKLRPKKQVKNTIKVQNKLFGNLQMEIEQQINSEQANDYPEGEVPTERLQLEFKPKTLTTSRAGSFLNKVEALKKHRGLEADIDQASFDKIAKQKAKRSINQLVSKIQNQVEGNEQIDIQIKAPVIAKGKSADLINNTMFIIKNLTTKNINNAQSQTAVHCEGSDQQNLLERSNNGENVNQATKKVATIQATTSSFINSTNTKKKPVSRLQFFKQIKQSINVRRSKYVSAQELKNSFKPSKLQQLEQIRQRRQERRKKEVMYSMGEIEDDDADDVIRELEDEVARNDRISKEDLRRLLREEEGINGLDQYQEENESKDKKKQLETEKDKQGTQQGMKASQLKVQSITINSLQQLKPTSKQHIMQKDSVSQHQKHADDMIDEYDEQVQNAQQMDPQQQQQEEDYQNENEDDEQEDEDENPQQQQQDNEYRQSSQKDNGYAEIQQERQQQDDIRKSQLRKELQQEGIIMPGVNNKRKAHALNTNQQIDPSKYIILSSNTQQPTPQQQQNLFIQSKKSNTLDNNTEETLQLKEFRKLRKIAVVIQEKKKKREEQLKRAKEFFEQEAQLGSDNEQNDDNVKAINKNDDSEEQDGDDLDQQLEELIDNAVDINEEDEDLAFRKYMQDVKEKDREELQRILRGDFRRHNQDMPELHEMQEDEKNRYDRMQKMMQWMRRRQDDQKDLYAEDSDDDDDQCNFYYDYNGNRKRINHKQKINTEGHGEETPQENQQEIEQKLRYFLMDTLSPAKAQTYQSKPTQLLTQLPQMFKKTKPFNKPFAKFDLDLNKKQDQKKHKKQQQQKNKNFAGNLFSLGSNNKGQNNGLTIPKSKKTSSHMSQELNKNKVQKPMGATVFSQNKLNSIFSRFSKPIKK